MYIYIYIYIYIYTAGVWDRESMVQACPDTDRHLSQAPTPQQPSGPHSYTGRTDRKPNAFRHKGRRSGVCRTFTGRDAITQTWNTSALRRSSTIEVWRGKGEQGLSCEEPHSQLQHPNRAAPAAAESQRGGSNRACSQARPISPTRPAPGGDHVDFYFRKRP